MIPLALTSTLAATGCTEYRPSFITERGGLLVQNLAERTESLGGCQVTMTTANGTPQEVSTEFENGVLYIQFKVGSVVDENVAIQIEGVEPIEIGTTVARIEDRVAARLREAGLFNQTGFYYGVERGLRSCQFDQ